MCQVVMADDFYFGFTTWGQGNPSALQSIVVDDEIDDILYCTTEEESARTNSPSI